MCPRATIASFFSFSVPNFYIWFFFLVVHTKHKKENVWPSRYNQKVDSIVICLSQGDMSKMDRAHEWPKRLNWIFKNPCHPEKCIFSSANFSTWLSWWKCEHELILFECKINYAKTFELILIAIYIYIMVFCFFCTFSWPQKWGLNKIRFWIMRFIIMSD